MEIVVEFAPEPKQPLLYERFSSRPRKPVPSCMRHQKLWTPLEVDMSDSMTWDTCLSPEWIRARWPEKQVKYIQIGRAFAPVHEIPIAQIPYLLVAAKYFDDDTIAFALQPFLNRKLHVALRDIDWLMVNYSKQYESSYFLQRDYKHNLDTFTPGIELVSIYEMYNNTLHMYRRRHFRTYKQSHRMYLWTNDSFEETTIGQLLCLMWAIEWGIVSYACAHCSSIKAHETLVSKTNQADIDKYKVIGVKRKRMELVIRPTPDVWVVEIPQQSLSLGTFPSTNTTSRRTRGHTNQQVQMQ